MGQYFHLVNYDKKEYVDHNKVGQSKLWEWCANNSARLLPFLLRKSNESGGGDIRKDYETAGRWAGDRIALVGDYDESHDYYLAKETFRDITEQVVKEYNDFIEVDRFRV